MDNTLTTIVAMRRCGQHRHTWKEIGAVAGMSWQAARGLWRRRDTSKDADAGDCPGCGAPLPDREKVAFEERGNYAEASSEGVRIQTLEALLDACEVDLDVWKVRDWGVKKWEVGAKAKEGHLAWTAGVMDGELDYRGLQVQDLWSVWAKFVRLVPVQLDPVIRPVGCNVTYRRPRPAARTLGRTLVFADPQFGFSRELRDSSLVPFHDRRALDVVLQVAAMEQPERIDILGDFFDLVMWTDRFLRSPRFEYTTQPAILEGHWWLRQFREAAPDAAIVLHEGNHDARMRKAIMTHLRAAYGLKAADEMEEPPALSPDKLLALGSLGIEWIGSYPNDLDWVTDTLVFYHGDVARKPPGSTGRALLEELNCSVVFGHIHRKELVPKSTVGRWGQRTQKAYCPGCVCRVDGGVPPNRTRTGWQQGFGIIDFAEAGFSIYDVEIEAGQAMWDRQMIVGRERAEDLRQDLPDWNW